MFSLLLCKTMLPSLLNKYCNRFFFPAFFRVVRFRCYYSMELSPSRDRAMSQLVCLVCVRGCVSGEVDEGRCFRSAPLFSTHFGYGKEHVRRRSVFQQARTNLLEAKEALPARGMRVTFVKIVKCACNRRHSLLHARRMLR